MLGYLIIGLLASAATGQWTELAEEVREVTATNGRVYTCKYKLKVKGNLSVSKKSWIRCQPDQRVKGVKATETFIVGDNQVEVTHNVKKGADTIVSVDISAAPVVTAPPPITGPSNLTCQCKPQTFPAVVEVTGRGLDKGGSYGSSNTALSQALSSLIGTFIIALITGFLAAAVGGAVAGRNIDPVDETELERSAIVKSIESNRQLFENILGGGSNNMNEVLVEQMMNQLLSNPELMNSLITAAIESGAVEQAIQSAIQNGVVENTIQSVINSGIIEEQLVEMANSGLFDEISKAFEDMLNDVDLTGSMGELMEENSLLIEEMVAGAIQEMVAEATNNPDMQLMEQLLGSLENAEFGLQCSCNPAEIEEVVVVG